MNSTQKRIMGILFLLIVFLGNPNITLSNRTIYAEVNHSYTNNDDEEIEDSDQAADDSTLLGLLAICIVSIGSLIQWLTTWIMSLFSGIEMFPWADKIIFNTIPLVDVNFINPASGSLFRNASGDFTTVGNVVRNIYFTGLSISLSFLGIIVAVMAIRMALSSIAAEKAKYKESIVTWLTAMVLLFGMHYVLSFVFYLNEKLVEVASEIVLDNMSAVTASGDSEKTGIDSSKVDKVISSMGVYFKEQAATDGNGWPWEWKNCRPIPATLYTVLVIQSLMFLFAYLKRFFYVTILAVLAPFVVVYDFMTKTMG